MGARVLPAASQQESFTSDIADLLETATWQDVTFDTTPELQEVATVRDEFHAWLDAHDHLERGQMIAEATDILADSAEEDVLDVDAVLAIEFEEFVEPDRRYLQHLADGRDLVCIAETDASIRRTWTETGPITDHVSFTDHETVDSTPPATRPAATAMYFARDEVSTDPETGDVQVLVAETADDEIERIADEIEQVRDQHDVAYEEMAVALKYSGEAVIEARQALEQAGIPTDSATVIGFGDDPAIRELLQVVYTLADEHELESKSDSETVVAAEEAALTDNLRRALAEMDHLGDAVRRWASESGLKERIGADTAPLTARTRFGNVRRAFNMADFLEDTAFMDATWASLAEMLTRAHEYAPQQNQTSAIERDGGVRVDHVRALNRAGLILLWGVLVCPCQHLR